MKNFFLTAALAVCLLACPAARAMDDTLKFTADKKAASLNVGDIEVVAIEDSEISMEQGLFSGPLPDGERSAYFPGKSVAASVNVFLVKTGGKTILIDSGWGPDGPVQGKTLARLAALGVTPENIDAVILTHMHLDHIGGLLDNGKAAFPRAVVMVSAPERDFWLDPAQLAGQYKDGAILAGQVAKAYGNRLSTFSFGDLVAPGITALDGVGHTPGHTMFMLASGNDRLLVVGDLLHAAALQLAHPDETVVYDVDQPKAALTRKAVLKEAGAKNTPIAGMHIPFAGIGRVKDNGQGGFDFTPFR